MNKIRYFIENNFWKKITFINLILLPFSFLYMLCHKTRYFISCIRQYKSKKPVICVGNYVVGGSGKTPAIIALIKILKSENLNVAVITKGYKGKIIKKQPLLVNLEKHNHIDVGDEAILLAEHAPTIASKNRKTAIKHAQQDADIILMDDGLQDGSIKKDLTILMAPYEQLNNNLVIPAGPLREPMICSVLKSDLIIGKNTGSKKFFCKIFSSINNYDNLLKKSYVLLCGIANPERVTKSLKKIKIIKSFFFPDHHQFSHNELKKIYNVAKLNNCHVLTTIKDLTRIPKIYHKNTEIIDFSIHFEKEKELKKKMLNLVQMV